LTNFSFKIVITNLKNRTNETLLLIKKHNYHYYRDNHGVCLVFVAKLMSHILLLSMKTSFRGVVVIYFTIICIIVRVIFQVIINFIVKNYINYCYIYFSLNFDSFVKLSNYILYTFLYRSYWFSNSNVTKSAKY
jgi:hypothetical protein